MNNLKFENRNFEGFTNRAGLYRVWVPLHVDGKARLISIWIDPKMTAFEPQVLEEPVTPSATDGDHVAEEIEDSGRRPITVRLRGALEWIAHEILTLS